MFKALYQMSRPENIGLDASDGDNDLLLPSFRGLSFSIGFYTSSFFPKASTNAWVFIESFQWEGTNKRKGYVKDGCTVAEAAECRKVMGEGCRGSEESGRYAEVR